MEEGTDSEFQSGRDVTSLPVVILLRHVHGFSPSETHLASGGYNVPGKHDAALFLSRVLQYDV